jgi:hypothetical protein
MSIAPALKEEIARNNLLITNIVNPRQSDLTGGGKPSGLMTQNMALKEEKPKYTDTCSANYIK